MTIDTLEYAKELEAAGVSTPRAEAHARVLKKAVDAGLATKADLSIAVWRTAENFSRRGGRGCSNDHQGD